MADTSYSVGKLEFESPINMENSFAAWNVAKKAKSIMELFFYKDSLSGFIEWDIPELDMTEGIGLGFEIDKDGKRKLVDYDGVFDLPKQAMDLLEQNGVDCSEMRETLADDD